MPKGDARPGAGTPRGDRPDSRGAEPPRPSGPRRGRGRLPWAAVLLLVVLIGAGIYAAWPSIKQSVETPIFEPSDAEVVEGEAAPEVPATDSAEPTPAMTEATAPEAAPDAAAARAQDAELNALRARLAALEQSLAERTAALEQAIARRPSSGLSAEPEAMQALGLRLDTLEDRVAQQEGADRALAVENLAARFDTLEQALESAGAADEIATWREQRAALATSVGAMAARVEQLSQSATRHRATDVRLVATVYAAGQLSAAARQSLPFARELEALRAVAGDDPAVAGHLHSLEAVAPRGVSTLDRLRARFGAAARDIIRAAALPEDGDWVDETLARLKQIVTVRRTTGEFDGASPETHIARAQTELAAGDLAAAVAALEQLRGPAAMGASDWLAEARARLSLERTVAALNSHVAGKLIDHWPEAPAPGG